MFRGSAPSGVEHLSDDAGGQHQRHQTGVAQHVGQPAGDVVQALDAAEQLLEERALVAALGADQAQRAEDQHARGCSASASDGDAAEHDPPG